MSILDYRRLDEAYFGMYKNKFCKEDAFEQPVQAQTQMTPSGEESSEEVKFVAGDFIVDKDGQKWEVTNVLPNGDIHVQGSEGEKAGKTMRIPTHYLSHFEKLENEEDCEDKEDMSTPPEFMKDKKKAVYKMGDENWAGQEDSEEEELGPDPKEADELENIMKGYKQSCEPDYQKTDVWKAYKAIIEGQWSEEDFLQWSRSVWAAGADESQNH